MVMPSSGQKNIAMTGISIRVIDPLIPACGRLRPNYQLRRQRLPSQCAEDTAGKKRLKTKRPDCYLLIHRPFFGVNEKNNCGNQDVPRGNWLLFYRFVISPLFHFHLAHSLRRE